MMTIIDALALVFISVLLIESVIWTLKPELLLSLAEYLYDRPILNQFLHASGAIVVLGLVVQAVSIEVVLAVSLFVGLLAGLIASPFGKQLVQVVRRSINEDRIWPHLVIPWLIMLALAGWSLASIFELV